MNRLLFIEDEPETIEPVLHLLSRHIEDLAYEVSSFDEAANKIISFRPDIVILDILLDGASPNREPEGFLSRDFIWDRQFCPIVIYSAQPEIYDSEYPTHPFIRSIKKGSRSPSKILKAIQDFSDHVDALREAEYFIRNSFALAMRDVAPYAFETFTEMSKRRETIVRSGRRRLAALMDEPDQGKTGLASWEQYIFPPISSNVKMGDILRKTDGESDDPLSFLLVLSPSCDMVATKDRLPKIEKVLVAKCCSTKAGLDRTSIPGIGKKKLLDRLSSTILTPGFFENIIPLPSLIGRIPIMIADLNNLELIKLSEIGNAGQPFLHIASIDSPFREQIAWAFLQKACRPGVPDRDFNKWCGEIIKELFPDDGQA